MRTDPRRQYQLSLTLTIYFDSLQMVSHFFVSRQNLQRWGLLSCQAIGQYDGKVWASTSHYHGSPPKRNSRIFRFSRRQFESAALFDKIHTDQCKTLFLFMSPSWCVAWKNNSCRFWEIILWCYYNEIRWNYPFPSNIARIETRVQYYKQNP